MSSILTICTGASLSSAEMFVNPSKTVLIGAFTDLDEASEERRGDIIGVEDNGRTVAIVETDSSVYSDSAGCW